MLFAVSDDTVDWPQIERRCLEGSIPFPVNSRKSRRLLGEISGNCFLETEWESPLVAFFVPGSGRRPESQWEAAVGSPSDSIAFAKCCARALQTHSRNTQTRAANACAVGANFSDFR